MRSSRSSILILPLLDHEAAVLADPDVMEFVESFRQGGAFHPACRPEDSPQGHSPPGGPPLVAPQAVLDSGPEVVADDPEAGLPGGLDIDLPLDPSGVGVVHDEPLAGCDASAQQEPLPMAGPEHVEVDPQVCVKEVLPIERGLARPLEPHEDDRLHASPPDPGGPMND